MKKPILFLCTMLAAGPLFAADLSISIQNLTRGIYFTPLLLAAHPSDTRLFTPGMPASVSLQEMAEGGSIASLVADLTAVGADMVENPAAGLLGPGETTTASLLTDDAAGNTQLSMVGMMLPTNDGFVGLDGITVPSAAGTYDFYVNAYDAGTEANDEIRGGGAPGAPGFPAPGPIDTAAGINGSGVNANVEGFVHIHRSVIGDYDAAGGVSDIDAVVHRWLNPIAKITVTVN